MPNQIQAGFEFEAIFQEAAIGIIVTNSRFEIILSNHFADKLFGYETSELLGENISILIPNHLKDRHQGHLGNLGHEKPISRPMGIGLDLKAKRKDGSLFPIEISLSHFKASDSMHYIAFVSDVTLKRKVEMELILKNQQINQLNETLEQEVAARTQALQNTLDKLEVNAKELEISLEKEKVLGDLKTRFVSMASHEFRTPLTSILGSATLIEKYAKAEDQPKREQHINRIKSSVSHLTEILEEFLSVGKLEDGKLEIHPTEFTIRDFLQDILTDFSTYQQGIHLELASDFSCIQDASILRKVIFNGLSNALKFSQKEVVLQVVQRDTTVELIIIDQGIGISEEDQKHLFERFFRGGNATVIQGTGLGLHLVDRYMRLLGGSVQIKSELNKGTELHIQFPMR
ncbi:PAS domain-containing sensor histidine kinase [Aquirufa sp. HETE-83D]|uniref:histidine kinase n=1 Tax=Aquirufa esocilacus TaxID=3096513 RepID=A0ABW6DG37_9BACT